MPLDPVTVRPLGEHALMIDVAASAGIALQDAVLAAADAVRSLRRAEVEDVVPARASVLVVVADHAPPAADLVAVCEQAVRSALAAGPVRRRDASGEALVEVPVVYDGVDLEDVADWAGLSVEATVARHASREYTAAFSGFAPGFVYLTGVDPAIAAPRLATPRTRVPAGAVALAGDMTAVYPAQSPGGWRLLGSTSAVMFDARRDPPSLVAPGDTVRFVRVRPDHVDLGPGRALARSTADVADAVSAEPAAPAPGPTTGPAAAASTGVPPGAPSSPTSAAASTGVPPGAPPLPTSAATPTEVPPGAPSLPTSAASPSGARAGDVSSSATDVASGSGTRPPERSAPSSAVRAPRPGLVRAGEPETRGPWLAVLEPGPASFVEDGGRPGYAHLGVGRSGAADRAALRLANRLLGNPQDAAAVETTLGGLVVRFADDRLVVVTGAPVRAVLDGRLVGHRAVLRARRGDVLRLGAPSAGLRTYLGIRGGIDAEVILGSRSTDVLGHLGPPALAAGDVLPLGRAPGTFPVTDLAPERLPASADDAAAVLVVRAGVRAEWFAPGALGALTASAYSVDPDSDRVAVRLAGPSVAIEPSAGPYLSEGLVRGAVQVPPDGRPLVFLADHPSTGGYPVIGVVDGADVDRLAQLRPGERVRWRVAEGAAQAAGGPWTTARGPR